MLLPVRLFVVKHESVLIDGGRGVGKSAALALCVLHARQQNDSILVLATRGEGMCDRYWCGRLGCGCGCGSLALTACLVRV